MLKINMQIKQRILTSFENPIKNKNEKLQSNTPEFNKLLLKLNDQNNQTNNNLNYLKILGTCVKGLGKYNSNINEYINKWSSKTLINKIKIENTPNNLLNLETNSNKINENTFFKSVTPTNNQSINNSANKINERIVYDYLKDISKFNNQVKGNLISNKEQIKYNFNYLNYFRPEKLYKLIFSSFISMNSLISEPIYQETPNEMVIHLFIYSFKTKNIRLNNKFSSNQTNENKLLNLDNYSNRFIEINKNKLNILCRILSHYFKKPVTLNIVKLHYPYFDSNIFVNLIEKVINKITIRKIMLKFFKKAIIKNPTRLKRKNSLSKIPSVLSGIKIRCAGRLLTHRVVPRITIKNIRRGALARGKVNYLSTSRITNKNKRGAYSITVSMGQNINI